MFCPVPYNFDIFCYFRGQESAGIVTSEGQDEQNFNCIKGEGLVATIFTEDKLAKLTGKIIHKETVYGSQSSDLIHDLPKSLEQCTVHSCLLTRVILSCFKLSTDTVLVPFM